MKDTYVKGMFYRAGQVVVNGGESFIANRNNPPTEPTLIDGIGSEGWDYLGAGSIDVTEDVNVTVDNTTGTPSGSASFQDNQFSFEFSGIKGEIGKSAYQIWLDAGHQGTEADFLASLHGNPGSSQDYPFELENSLNGGVNKALTAEQGKVLDGKVTQLGQGVTELNAGVFGGNFSKNLIWTDGYIKKNGQIMSSTASKFTQPFVLKAGEKLTVGTNNANICIIGTTSAVSLSVGDTITVLQTTANSSTFETHTLIADEDMVVVVCVRWSDYSLTFEETNSFKQDYDKRVIPSTEHTRNLADGATVMNDRYIGNSNYIGNEAGCKCIYFPCKKNTTYTISKFVTSRFRVGLSSVVPEFNVLLTGVISDNTAESITITTANDSLFIVAWLYNSSGETKPWADVLASLQMEEGATATAFVPAGWTAVDKEARGDISKLNVRVSNAETDAEYSAETLRGDAMSLGDIEVVAGSYRGYIGGINPNSSYFYTTPIKVHKGDVVSTGESVTVIDTVAVISEVTSDGTYISTLKRGSGVAETINYTINKDCFISISATNGVRSLFSVSRKGLEERVNYLSSDATQIDSATRLPSIGTNPLAEIRRDAGYGSIIRKWGVIGDSLSSGEMQCFNDESESSSDYKFIDMYKYSTGQVFARLIGADVYNFSEGGQTTFGWIKRGYQHDDTYIGGVGGGGWSLARQSENLKDGYIIALGVNDLTMITRGEYELGSTSQITTYTGDDNDIDDATTYPKSFVRYYAGIIQRILSVQPKAKIFCVTMPGDNYAEIAQAIRDIVSYFGGNVYLMDIRTYIPEGHNVVGFRLNGHLSPMGYAYWAYMYNTYIDWIIRNNGNAFLDTAIIGTEYRPDYA